MNRRTNATVKDLDDFRVKLMEAEKSRTRLRNELNDIQLSSINEQNFFKVELSMTQSIHMVMSFEPKSRTPKDIDILEQSTSFLTFFQTIRIEDPTDEYKVHRRTCEHLTLIQSDKGKVICQHSIS